jgi:hypothetical protein
LAAQAFTASVAIWPARAREMLRSLRTAWAWAPTAAKAREAARAEAMRRKGVLLTLFRSVVTVGEL